MLELVHSMHHNMLRTVKYFNPITCLALLRCARDQLPQVRKALSTLGLINGKRVVAQVTLTSGIMALYVCGFIVYIVVDCTGRLAQCRQAVQEQEVPILQAARLNDRVRR